MVAVSLSQYERMRPGGQVEGLALEGSLEISCMISTGRPCVQMQVQVGETVVVEVCESSLLVVSIF